MSGPFELLPNSSVTPNYRFYGDDRPREPGSGEGMYKVVCGSYAHQVEQWGKGQSITVHELLQQLQVHGCDYLVCLGCKGKSGDMKEASEIELSADPQYAYGWVWLGREGGGVVNGIHYNSEECDQEARRAAIYAVTQRPGCASSWETLAELSGHEGDYTKQGCLKRVLDIDPGYGRVWDILGDLGGGEVGGVWFSSIECYERAHELDPGNQNGCLMLARKNYLARSPCPHVAIFCDGCYQAEGQMDMGIFGIRYQKTGYDYDLCEACFEKLPPSEQIQYEPLDRSLAWCVRTTEQSTWWRSQNESQRRQRGFKVDPIGPNQTENMV